MLEHMIKSRDNSSIMTCYYCNSDLSERESEWVEGFHYKTIRCRCGKVHRHTVDFLGSGHDTWNELYITKKPE
ncbi:MAG: hypothetical protein ACLFPQ_05215 [Candidatus Woesearchaeota archaeon]